MGFIGWITDELLLTKLYRKRRTHMEANVAAAAETTQTHSTPIIVGSLVVLGSHLVSQRMLEIVDLLANKITPNGVASINFRNDNTPTVNGETVFAKFFADSLSIMINIPKHLNEVYDSIEAGTTASIKCLFWESMLISLAHEFFHAKSWLQAPEELKNTILGDEKHEKEAVAFSRRILEELIKSGENLEPSMLEPIVVEENNAIINLLSSDTDDSAKDDVWLKKQARMIEEGTMFEDEDGNAYFTFASFMRSVSDNIDDPAWNTERKEAAATTAVVVTPTENTTEPEEKKTISEDLLKPQTSTQQYQVETDIPDQSQYQVEELPPVDMMDDFGMDNFSIENSMSLMFAQMESQHNEVPYNAVDTPKPTAFSTTQNAYASVTAPNIQQNAYVPEIWQNNSTAMAPAAIQTSPTPAVTLQPVNMTKEQQIQTVEQVFARLFYNLFGKCDFNPAFPNSFGHPEGILENVIQITDIPGATQIFLSHDHGDQAVGMVMEEPITNGIRGYITKSMRLPAYSLWVNRGGVKKQFKFLPQSPSKTYPAGHTLAGQLKPSAARVRNQGSAIAWVVEETPQGVPSNYLIAYEMDVGKPISWRWLNNTTHP